MSGRRCRICGRVRANERFSGKGHRIGICKDCQKLPRAEREKVEFAEEIAGFLDQSRISEKNRKRLKLLAEHEDERLRELAGLVLGVAEIAEGKRRRWKKVLEADPSLYDRCQEFGLYCEQHS